MKIIKVDILGLGMMVLADCRELVPRHYGVTLDYAQIPQDPAVYKTIQEADTVGLFQIESRSQMSALPHTRPQCFEDLSQQVAIIRPGPVTGQLVNSYIKRKLGRQPITYLHPSFEPFLHAVHPSRARTGKHCGEGDWLAQLPSLAGDEPAGDGSGREGGAGIIAARER